MRILTILLSVLTIGPMMVLRADENPDEHPGGHGYGSCLVGGNYSTCVSYLAKLSNSNDNNINYLAEVSCPGCVNGEVEKEDQYGNVTYYQICPPGKTWSDPVDDNLDTPNLHHHDAGDGDTGATVTGFKERVCWRGGNCIEGICKARDSGQVDFGGDPIFEYSCNRSGGKIWYVIKEFGSTCDNNQYDAGYSSGGPPTN